MSTSGGQKEVTKVDAGSGSRLDHGLTFHGANFIRYAGWGGLFLVIFLLLNATWFKVDQTERANVRRFGVAIYSKPVPVSTTKCL